MCAPTWVTLQKTNQGRYISTEGKLLSYRHSTLDNSSKILKMFFHRLHSPLGSLLLNNGVDKKSSASWPQHYFNMWYSSLRFHSSNSSLGGNYIRRIKRILTCKVHTIQFLKQAHLFAIILKTIWLILIGNTYCSVS